MRYAIISDIHGNLHSLELALADINKSQVDQIICLGDIASLGPQPNEVIALLRELEIPTIMGNHENYLLDPQLTEAHLPWLRKAELWCVSLLSEDDLDYMRAFPSELCYKLDEKTTMCCYHGSPRSNEEFLYPTVTSETLDQLFNDKSTSLFVCGHTHVQMVRQHKHMTLINPGSIGMPFVFPMRGHSQHAIRRAEYAIIDMTD